MYTVQWQRQQPVLFLGEWIFRFWKQDSPTDKSDSGEDSSRPEVSAGGGSSERRQGQQVAGVSKLSSGQLAAASVDGAGEEPVEDESEEENEEEVLPSRFVQYTPKLHTLKLIGLVHISNLKRMT